PVVRDAPGAPAGATDLRRQPRDRPLADPRRGRGGSARLALLPGARAVAAAAVRVLRGGHPPAARAVRGGRQRADRRLPRHRRAALPDCARAEDGGRHGVTRRALAVALAALIVVAGPRPAHAQASGPRPLVMPFQASSSE